MAAAACAVAPKFTKVTFDQAGIRAPRLRSLPGSCDFPQSANHRESSPMFAVTERNSGSFCRATKGLSDASDCHPYGGQSGGRRRTIDEVKEPAPEAPGTRRARGASHAESYFGRGSVARVRRRANWRCRECAGRGSRRGGTGRPTTLWERTECKLKGNCRSRAE